MPLTSSLLILRSTIGGIHPSLPWPLPRSQSNQLPLHGPWRSPPNPSPCFYTCPPRICHSHSSPFSKYKSNYHSPAKNLPQPSKVLGVNSQSPAWGVRAPRSLPAAGRQKALSSAPPGHLLHRTHHN